jgi:hypothetical protein
MDQIVRSTILCGGGVKHIMLAYLGRSTVQKLVTLFFVSVISFLIIHLAPGEPSQIDPLNPKFTPEIVERMRAEFHLDKPLYPNTCCSIGICSPAGSSPGKTTSRCLERYGSDS